MRLAIDKRKCSGCRLCEMVCSLHHFGSVNPEKSAIRIHKDDLHSSLNTPRLCLHCVDQKMVCLQGLPEEERDPAAARKRFFWSVQCVVHCPHHGVFPLGNMALHCDLCQGDPHCVSVCTPGAITIKG